MADGSDLPIRAWAEMEQQVLGTLLLDEHRIAMVAGRGGKTLFRDPVHAELYSVMAQRERDGLLVSPVALANIPAVVEMLADFGGPAYLARMAGVAIGSAFPAYLDALVENREKRALAQALEAARVDLEAGTFSAADVAAKLEAATMAVASSRSSVKPVSFMSAMTDALVEVNDAWEGREAPSVPTSIPELDRIMGRMSKGDLVLLGGRPSMGKTAIGLSMATRAAKAGHPVIFVSLEMTPPAIALRALAEEAAGRENAVPYAQARRGDMTPEQYDNLVRAARDMQGIPMHFLPRAYAEPAALYMGAKQALARMQTGKTPLIVVDYLQLMKVPGASRFEQITAISIGLKDAAMRLECPVLALSQLSRAVEQREDRRPQLSDLRESGQLEQDADAILFAYRDEYYISREEPDPMDVDAHLEWQAAMDSARNRLEIIVAKQRQGEVGTARVRFNPALNLIWSDGDRL